MVTDGIHVLQVTPGRLDLRVPALADAELARTIEAALALAPGLRPREYG